MQALGYPVYDADNHLYEPTDAITRHLEKRFAKEVQFVEVNGRRKLLVCGKISDYIPNPTFEVVAPPGAAEIWYRGKNPEGKSLREIFGKPEKCRDEYRDRAKRLALMDQQGVHATLLHPTLMSAMEQRMKHDADLLHAVFHSFNQYVLDDWGLAYQDRIFAVPQLSLMDVKRAVDELEWLLERGARVVAVRPAPVPGYKGSRSPAYPEFDPFWARVNEAGILVAMHASDSGYDEYSADWDGGREFLPFQPSAFRSVTMGDRPIFDTMAALIIDGLFHRHPNVRVASIENGSGWVIPLLRKLERTSKLMPWEFHEPPTETFRKHISVAPFYEEDIRGLAGAITIDRVLFGSDFPHPEGLAEPLAFLDELDGFDAAETRQIMSANLQGLLTPRPA